MHTKPFGYTFVVDTLENITMAKLLDRISYKSVEA